MLTILELETKLKKAWSLDTCSPDFHRKWTALNNSAGQCAITALIVCEHFGGEIKKCYVYDDPHYFNIVSGRIVDLTKLQFGKTRIDYANSETKTREEILSNPDTAKRYELLKNSL